MKRFRIFLFLFPAVATGLIALGIIVIGARFFLAPHAAAVAFGVPLPPDPRWEAYLSVKAVRDIASGFFIGILILNQAPHVLGWFMLAATIIPLTDAGIVLGHGGTKGPRCHSRGDVDHQRLIAAGLISISNTEQERACRGLSPKGCE
jgi:hypothetical protein